MISHSHDTAPSQLQFCSPWDREIKFRVEIKGSFEKNLDCRTGFFCNCCTRSNSHNLSSGKYPPFLIHSIGHYSAKTIHVSCTKLSLFTTFSGNWLTHFWEGLINIYIICFRTSLLYVASEHGPRTAQIRNITQHVSPKQNLSQLDFRTHIWILHQRFLSVTRANPQS